MLLIIACDHYSDIRIAFVVSSALFVTREVRNLTTISRLLHIRPHTLRPAAATRDSKLYLWWVLEPHMVLHPSEPIY